MQVTTDDALRQVDARFLGLPRLTFPWNPVRYHAYLVGSLILVAITSVAWLVAGTGAWTYIYALAVTIVITTRVMRNVDDERPLSAVAPLLWSEIGASRGSPHLRPRSRRHGYQSVAIFEFTTGRRLTLAPNLSTAQPDHTTSSPEVRHADIPSPQPFPTTAGASTVVAAAADSRSCRLDLDPRNRLVSAGTRAVELPTRP